MNLPLSPTFPRQLKFRKPTCIVYREYPPNEIFSIEKSPRKVPSTQTHISYTITFATSSMPINAYGTIIRLMTVWVMLYSLGYVIQLPYYLPVYHPTQRWNLRWIAWQTIWRLPSYLQVTDYKDIYYHRHNKYNYHIIMYNYKYIQYLIMTK